MVESVGSSFGWGAPHILHHYVTAVSIPVSFTLYTASPTLISHTAMGIRFGHSSRSRSIQTCEVDSLQAHLYFHTGEQCRLTLLFKFTAAAHIRFPPPMRTTHSPVTAASALSFIAPPCICSKKKVLRTVLHVWSAGYLSRPTYA